MEDTGVTKKNTKWTYVTYELDDKVVLRQLDAHWNHSHIYGDGHLLNRQI